MTEISTQPAFEFIGFDPTPGVATRAMEKIARIFSESPSDAFARAFVRKTVRGFEGRLQVRSAVGTFVAEVFSDDPSEVVDKLSWKMRSQLRMWKRHRFA